MSDDLPTLPQTPPRAVMDTNVLCAAFHSRAGASFELFRRLRLGHWTAILSNHLLHEYEEKLREQRLELGLSRTDIELLLDAVCAQAEEWPLRPGWTPLLSDPDDEPMVELAVESGAMCIVTHNVRHLKPAAAVGIAVCRGAIKAGQRAVKLGHCAVKAGLRLFCGAGA